MDIDANRDEAEEQRRAVPLDDCLVVDGVFVSAKDEDYAALAKMIREGIPDKFRRTPKRTALLAELASVQAERHGAGDGRSRKPLGRLPPPSQAQLKAIDLAGEIAAFEWLKARYPAEFSEDCWVSEYRDLVCGDTHERDCHGYDFEVRLKTRSLFFEVKTAAGYKTHLTLGENEIRKAQECAADRRECYRILFITFALDSARRSLMVLPNPFSRQGRSRFLAVGTSSCYRFKPASVAAAASPRG